MTRFAPRPGNVAERGRKPGVNHGGIEEMMDDVPEAATPVGEPLPDRAGRPGMSEANCGVAGECAGRLGVWRRGRRGAAAPPSWPRYRPRQYARRSHRGRHRRRNGARAEPSTAAWMRPPTR
ncbi:MAG: hypothetical protein R3A10_09815 [Caldilineaceae bacterium]